MRKCQLHSTKIALPLPNRVGATSLHANNSNAYRPTSLGVSQHLQRKFSCMMVLIIADLSSTDAQLVWSFYHIINALRSYLATASSNWLHIKSRSSTCSPGEVRVTRGLFLAGSVDLDVRWRRAAKHTSRIVYYKPFVKQIQMVTRGKTIRSRVFLVRCARISIMVNRAYLSPGSLALLAVASLGFSCAELRG